MNGRRAPDHGLTAAPRLLLVAVGMLAAMLVLAACSGGGGSRGCASPGGASSQPEDNQFANGSFEDGAAPWISLESDAWGKPFTVSSAFAKDGANSALLELRSEEGGPARVFGVVQEITPDEFPGVLSGYYCVEEWKKGTPRQYLQFVVIAHGAENIPEEIAFASNHQIRYILAGVESQPTNITNARYVFLTRSEPETGTWVRFERNVREDFEELWGNVPQGYEKIRVLFEVRWDDRLPTADESAADVYYDDLYWGAAP